MGLPGTEVRLSELTVLAKSIFAHDLVYFITLAVIKISILIMYCRAFGLRSVRIGAWMIGTIVILWAIITIFVVIFQCTPVSRQLNPALPGKCMPFKQIFIGTAVPNIVTDVAILTMPVYHVRKLKLPHVQRATLMVIFLLGCFVIFASAYRLASVLQAKVQGFSAVVKLPTMWSHIETCIAIVSACLPCMRPLLTQLLTTLGLDSNASSRRSNIVGSQGTIGGTARKQTLGGRKRRDIHMDNELVFRTDDEELDYGGEKGEKRESVATHEEVIEKV